MGTNMPETDKIYCTLSFASAIPKFEARWKNFCSNKPGVKNVSHDLPQQRPTCTQDLHWN